MQDQQDTLTPLYVRLPQPTADALDRAAFEAKTSKRELVANALDQHLGRIEFRPAPQDPPEVLTAAQAADLLQTDEATVARLAEQGELPGRNIGGEWRFARAALVAWLSHSH